jgi:DNA-binding NtrC family response regulator
MDILLVDDEKINLITLRDGLEDAGHTVTACPDAEQGLAAAAASSFDLAILDHKLPGGKTGLDMLKEIKRSAPQTDVMIMSAFGTIDIAVSAMKNGAFDFITKPFSLDEILLKIEKLARHRELKRENVQLRREVQGRFSFVNMIGRSERTREVFRLIESFAASPSSVLITGESGTGKGLTSRVIHYNSPRSALPFVEIHCGAIPENILESELFGHKKGSFTGANQDREGKLEAAAGGTVALDDIDTMPMPLQVKLLRVLQDGRFERIGSNRTLELKARVITTAKPTIEQDVAAGRFREDLYYRINTLRIDLPALRERTEDIPALADFFIAKYGPVIGSAAKAFKPDAMEALMNYPFPGNVRELEHMIERILHLSKGDCVMLEDLPREIVAPSKALITMNPGDLETGKRSYTRMMEDAEKKFIQWAVRKAGGNQSEASRLLDMPRSTLQEKIKRYNID